MVPGLATYYCRQWASHNHIGLDGSRQRSAAQRQPLCAPGAVGYGGSDSAGSRCSHATVRHLGHPGAGSPAQTPAGGHTTGPSPERAAIYHHGAAECARVAAPGVGNEFHGRTPQSHAGDRGSALGAFAPSRPHRRGNRFGQPHGVSASTPPSPGHSQQRHRVHRHHPAGEPGRYEPPAGARTHRPLPASGRPRGGERGPGF